jgi:hypothetical protein
MMNFFERQSVVMRGGGDYSKTSIKAPEDTPSVGCEYCGCKEVKEIGRTKWGFPLTVCKKCGK